jgi:hypothetical protein
MLSINIFGYPHSLCSFLDNIHRILEKDYEPSDVDVSRVRSLARTGSGVQEYHYLLDTGACFIVERVRLHVVVDPIQGQKQRLKANGFFTM